MRKRGSCLYGQTLPFSSPATTAAVPTFLTRSLLGAVAGQGLDLFWWLNTAGQCLELFNSLCT